jgi:hypothetical protein
MSISTYEIAVHCDHPGCTKVIHVQDIDQAREIHPDWTLQLIAMQGPFPMPEDWCPEHGRCNWCHERKPRARLTKGAGDCEGQLICTDCILRKEG